MKKLRQSDINQDILDDIARLKATVPPANDAGLTNEQKLRAMIEEASLEAEAAFAVTGVVPPTWLIDAVGRRGAVPAPPFDKDTAAEIVRMALKALDADRCCFIDEAWCVHMPADADPYAVAPREHPDRQEIVMFAAEDHEQVITAKRSIIRDGKKATLGPLVFDPRSKESSGRFVGMLAPRGGRQ